MEVKMDPITTAIYNNLKIQHGNVGNVGDNTVISGGIHFGAKK